MEPTIYINIGLIGTGKSTFANKIAQTSPILIVSKDSIRQMLFGRYKFDEIVEPLISKITDLSVINCLSEIILGIAPYNSLIIDDCNLTKKDRLTIVNLVRQIEMEYLKENFFKITYVYFLDADSTGLTRRLQETRSLKESHWENVWDWQLRRIEVPSSQELKEYKINSMTTIKV